MRVLFACRPFIGHLYPMMPLALALRRDGHDVAFATAAAFIPEVTRLGMEAVAAGLDPRHPPPSPDGMAPGYSLDVIGSKTEDIVAHSADSPVDLLVREPTDFSGVFAAEILGRPQVTLGRSQVLTPSHWLQFIGPALELVRRKHHLSADPELARIFGSCYLDMVPAWFQPPRVALPRNRIEIRPDSYDGPTDPLDELWSPSSRNGIYVTFGTVYNHNVGTIRAAVAAASSLGRSVLCTVGRDQNPEYVIPEPQHDVTVTSYVPQSAVLPNCSLVICHGGYSTVMGAICSGLPLVIIPQGSDHEANARQCEELGVGLTVDRGQFSMQAVRDAASRVLGDPSFAERTRDLAQRAAGVSPVQFGVRLLDRLPALHNKGLDVTGRRLVGNG